MESGLPHYPTVEFLVKYGQHFAVTLGALPVVLGVILAWFFQIWLLALAGVVAGGVLYVVTRSYVELVQIIADMLLPK